jgi:hypothetical protein
MVRRGFFQGLRRRGAVLGAVLAYALLLNALAAAVLNVQAVAAALDPLAAAATCDTSGSSPAPVRHQNQHQPDCTLCSSACPMGGIVKALGGGGAVIAPHPSAAVIEIGAPPTARVHPTSVYRSDTGAQAPPVIG